MSRASGRFADFFPTAPSVLQERKRAAQERQRAKPKQPDLQDANSAAGNEVLVHRDRSKDSTQGPRDTDEKHSANGDVGDLLNGVGSASSLASTVSSVFSGPGQPQPLQTGAGGSSMTLTPLTNHESSPPERTSSPKQSKDQPDSRHVNSSAADLVTPVSAAPGGPSDAKTTIPTPPQTQVRLRPGHGEAKGIRAIYDPELDPKLPAKDRRKVKVRYKKFGEEEFGAPPDPRLAVAGYKDGINDLRLSGEAKVWKFRLRHAPYTIHKYSWDPSISIGPGPPTAIVVTGFDPFTREPQLRALFGSYGEIAELHNKTDPNTGIFLGVCSIRYRDSRSSRGPQISATEAAKSAEKNGSGQRIGVRTVKVELDRAERKCKIIVDKLARRNRERQAHEHAEATRPAPPAPPEPAATLAPPPNAPKGPSGKPKPPIEAPRQMTVVRPGATLIESESVLSQIKRKPYVFISKAYVPVMGTTIPHLKKRMKLFDWREVRCDETGYFIVFENSKRGEDEAVRCYKMMHMEALFTYTMNMECQQYGNPDYERSPTPERALAEQKAREEQERVDKENEMDINEEKKQRALDLDPVKAALEQLRIELRDKIMGDVKSRIAAPSLYECLDPERHAAKRQKLGIPDPTEMQRPATLLSLGGDESHVQKSPYSRTPGGSVFRKNVLSQNHSRSHLNLHPNNAFIDERRQRRPARKVDVRPLHLRLQDFYEDGDSDDEHPTSVTHDAEEQDSRSISRMSSVQPSGDHDEDPVITPKKRQVIERDETPHEEDSGDEGLGIARTVLDPHMLKKEPEDMAPRELQLILDTLPRNTKLFKRAQREKRIRQKTRDDDQLFRIRSEQASEPTPAIDKQGESDMDMADFIQTEEPISASKAKKAAKSKTKRKSKRQIFEEREAAKAGAITAKALLQGPEDIATPETPLVEEIPPEKPEEEDEEEEEPRADVEWGVSTAAPRRTVEDSGDMVLDPDGWQHLLKDNEDAKFMSTAMTDGTHAKFSDPNLWAFAQKEIKTLNNGGNSGPTRDVPKISGYYIPNLSGAARTEGVKKILESEKSKYLPHRIKVAEARQRRAAEVNDTNSISAVEAARQAKQASTATSRSARANNRTVVKDFSIVKQNLAEGQQSDAIRFNQLKRRKKLLRFARSAIHGWGLYAEEDIDQGDMIIEYVGEKVRQAVANVRELRYDKQGMGSSYLFRIDEDTVVDATKKGGIARFINHSCTPNSMAKIIKVDGEKRIVIYALKAIKRNDEVVYDYKFAREEDPDNRVPCLCGSANCKGFLN